MPWRWGLSVLLVSFLFFPAFAVSLPADLQEELDSFLPTLEVSPSVTVIGLKGYGTLHLEYDPDGPEGPALKQFVPSGAVRWLSSNRSVARVDLSGRVWGVRPGEAAILGTYLGTTQTAQVKISGKISSHRFQTPDGRRRSYLLYLPAGYRSEAPTPLVLSYHGGLGNGQHQMDNSQMNATADEKGFIVAYPNGTGPFGLLTWNSGNSDGYAATHHVDDIAFTALMIEDLKGKFNIDPARIFATGHSNGAEMVHRLACKMSHQIAAFAPVNGGLNLGGDFLSCSPIRAVSLMAFHGMTDDNYPFYGGTGTQGPSGVSHYSIPDTISDWLHHNHLQTTPAQITYQQGSVTCETTSEASMGVEVTLCTADPPFKIEDNYGANHDGGGHAWPGGVRWGRIADVPTQDISANAAMWDFFSRYPLSLPPPHETAPGQGSPGVNQDDSSTNLQMPGPL